MHHCMNMMETNFPHSANFDHVPLFLLASPVPNTIRKFLFLIFFQVSHYFMKWGGCCESLSYHDVDSCVCLFVCERLSCVLALLLSIFTKSTCKYNLITLFTYPPFKLLLSLSGKLIDSHHSPPPSSSSSFATVPSFTAEVAHQVGTRYLGSLTLHSDIFTNSYTGTWYQVLLVRTTRSWLQV